MNPTLTLHSRSIISNVRLLCYISNYIIKQRHNNAVCECSVFTKKSNPTLPPTLMVITVIIFQLYPTPFYTRSSQRQENITVAKCNLKKLFLNFSKFPQLSGYKLCSQTFLFLFFFKCLEKNDWCLEDFMAEKSLQGLRMSPAQQMPKALHGEDAQLDVQTPLSKSCKNKPVIATSRVSVPVQVTSLYENTLI